MAFTINDTGAKLNQGVTNPASVKTTPDKYTALDDFLLSDENAVNRPDVREMLVKTYGDQGITGFLTLTGAVKNAGQADQVEWFEEGRRHRLFYSDSTINSAASGSTLSFETTAAGGTQLKAQKYDVFMHIPTGERVILTTDEASTHHSWKTLSGDSIAIADHDAFALIGNMYPQGSNQPSNYMEPEVARYRNPFMIVKERYQVTGSQATNIGYINTGNGDYRWFMHGESEARKRFNDKRELMMLCAEKPGSNLDGQGQLIANTDTVNGLAGSEGYFSAVESRGLVTSGSFASINDFDTLILELDKQGAPAEYAMYLNRQFELDIDDLLAQGIATQVTAGLSGQFGAFNNDPNMAIKLGFQSFSRGGYTFHKHSWKLLNDPTLLGTSNYKGAMVPMAQVADAKTGAKAPALEMNYKAANGYSREMEHWVTGGNVLGYNNNGDSGNDTATFHYRSECNLVVRAANQHVALKG
jgi:hypothetical protein